MRLTDTMHIPVFELCDLMDMIIDEEHFQKYGSHLRICERCQESFEYAKRNISAPTIIRTITETIEFHPETQHKGKVDERHSEWVTKFFDKYGTNVNIVAGEASPLIFTQEVGRSIQKVLDSIKTELQDDDKIKFVCGPVIAIDNDFRGDSGQEGSILPSLAKDKNFLLYVSATRQKTHFRIGGKNKELYVEGPHSACQDDRESSFFTNPIVCNRFAKKFDYVLSSPKVRLSKNPERDFIYLTLFEIKKLQERATELGLEYDKLGKEDLEQLIEKYRL